MAGTTTARKRTAAKAAPAPVVEDEFDEELEEMDDETGDDELEELEDDAEPEAAEKPKRKPPTRPKIDFGSAELAAHITEKTGESMTARDVRMLLRKLAKDGVLEREVGTDKARYEFSGPNDPTVKAVVKMVQDGTAKAMKQAGLQAVKDNAAAKKAAAAKAKAEAAEDDDFEEEPEETPKPAPRKRAAAAKAAPAKATATRRRAAATK